MNKILRAYKFRCYPNSTQEVLLNKTFGCVRFVWNKNVQTFNTFNKNTCPNPNFKTTTELRKEFDWLQEVSAAAIQQKESDFKKFKQQFFNRSRGKKLGRPKFKKKGTNQSFRLPNQKFSLIDNKIRLEKIGKIRVSIDREIPSDAKFMSVTVSRNTCGQYFVSILVEEYVNTKPLTKKEVGVDVGVKSFAIQSDNIEIDNPKFFGKSQTKLKKLQRRLSKKQKGSNRYNKVKKKISKLHLKISNQRSWFLHNYSTFLLDNYDIIFIEDLDVQGLIQKKQLSKEIGDVGWGIFFSMLLYKADWYGKQVIKIDRYYPSSKTCSQCDWVDDNLTLSDRQFNCKNCGHVINRDLNAAINIKRVGVNALYNQSQSF